MLARRPHRDVADRLRTLLDSVGLSRGEFVEAVGGAIGARSLYSVLNGTRRPSRALAVLIERTWGFRSEYLLTGRGEAWTEPQAIGPGVVALELSAVENAVIKFMRTSVENARTMKSALEQAQAWSRLFGRSLALIRELDVLGNSDSDQDRRIYPLLVKIVYEDCRFMAGQYEQLITLCHRRRVHKLSDDFLGHFVGDVARGPLPPDQQEALGAMLRPVVELRRRKLQAIERAIDHVLANVDNVCRLDSLVRWLRARCDDGSARRRLDAVGRLTALTGPLSQEIQALLDQMASEADPAATYWRRLQKLLRDLLKEIDQDIPTVEIVTVEELRARHEALLDPLTA
jgi:hypothetical protein